MRDRLIYRLNSLTNADDRFSRLLIGLYRRLKWAAAPRNSDAREEAGEPERPEARRAEQRERSFERVVRHG